MQCGETYVFIIRWVADAIIFLGTLSTIKKDILSISLIFWSGYFSNLCANNFRKQNFIYPFHFSLFFQHILFSRCPQILFTFKMAIILWVSHHIDICESSGPLSLKKPEFLKDFLFFPDPPTSSHILILLILFKYSH